MTNKNYSTEEIFKGILGMDKEERNSLLKHMTIDNLTSVVSDSNTFFKAMSEIETQIRDWEAAKSGIDKLSKNLKKENSNGIYKYANTEVMPEIDGYTFARLVNLVSKVTQKSLSSCSDSIYTILWRLYFIKEHSNNQLKSIPDSVNTDEILTSEEVLKTFNITFDKKLFWVLNDISKRWKDYSSVEKTALAKSISGIHNVEAFLVLMENWRGVDNPVICGEVEEILHSCRYISGSVLDNNTLDFEASLKKMNITIYDELVKSKNFQDVLDDAAKCYDRANEDERRLIVKLFSGSLE